MSAIDQLLQDHRDLLALGDQLNALLGIVKPATAELARARWQISSLVGRHLAAQDEVMRTLVRVGLKPNEQLIFDQYFADLVDLRLSFAEHNCEWTLDSIHVDWTGYRIAARAQIRGLRNRIAWEEQFLFPVLRHLETVLNDAARVDQRSAA